MKFIILYLFYLFVIINVNSEDENEELQRILSGISKPSSTDESREHYTKPTEIKEENTTKGKEENTTKGEEENTTKGKEENTTEGKEENTTEGKEENTTKGKEENTTKGKEENTTKNIKIGVDLSSVDIKLEPLSSNSIEIRSREGIRRNDIIAKAILKSSLNQTGWNILEVWTNVVFDDEKQAFWGGYAEGCITTTLISQHENNTKLPEKIVKEASKFIKNNLKWIQKNIKKLKHENGKWWQISLFYEQLKGLYNGYKQCKSKGDKEISFSQFVLMNADGDMHDLLQKYNKTKSDYGGTAIVKVLPGNYNLYVAHTTWNSYNYMTRLLKNYIFQYRISSKSKKLVPGRQITFSGYPGIIYSTDDFYTISSGLTITQTWISNNKKKLWKKVKPKGTVLAGPRIMAANRLADDSKQWYTTLSFSNSGTFNNQWLVIDYKMFTPGKPLRHGLFDVIEQLPDQVLRVDLTKLLEKERYFASHNLPKFLRTFKLVDKPANKKYRSFYIYKTSPVIKLINEKQSSVLDLQSMMDLIRYNNYTYNKLSQCEGCIPPYSASVAIAARNDLNCKNGTYPLDSLGFHPSGAIDGKVISHELAKSLKFGAVSGPTSGIDLPIFTWKNLTNQVELRHAGQPDEWNFKPVLTNWEFSLKKKKSMDEHLNWI